MADKSQQEWIDSLSQCSKSSVGTMCNKRYGTRAGKSTNDHDFLHEAINIEERGIRLYGLFCGYNGQKRAAQYVANRLIHEIFNEHPIRPEMGDEEIMWGERSSFGMKFDTVARAYNDDMAQLLTEKMLLKESNPSDEKTAEIAEIDANLRAGTTVLTALIVGTNLYLLNCGNSRGIIIKENAWEDLECFELNDCHDNECPEEISRLERININPDTILAPTRAIGDCFRNELGYLENSQLEGADGPPVIPEAVISHWEMPEDYKFLLLVSHSVVTMMEELNIPPEDVNRVLMERCIREWSVGSVQKVAQALIDSVARDHLNRFTSGPAAGTCSNHGDMSAIFVCLREDRKIDLTNSLKDSVAEPTSHPTSPLHAHVDLDGFDQLPDAARIMNKLRNCLGFDLLNGTSPGTVFEDSFANPGTSRHARL